MADDSSWRFSHLGTEAEEVARTQEGHASLRPADGGPVRRVSSAGLDAGQRRRLERSAAGEPVPEELARALIHGDHA